MRLEDKVGDFLALSSEDKLALTNLVRSERKRGTHKLFIIEQEKREKKVVAMGKKIKSLSFADLVTFLLMTPKEDIIEEG